jgi:hypothetical protein
VYQFSVTLVKFGNLVKVFVPSSPILEVSESPTDIRLDIFDIPVGWSPVLLSIVSGATMINTDGGVTFNGTIYHGVSSIVDTIGGYLRSPLVSSAPTQWFSTNNSYIVAALEFWYPL